MEGPRFQFNLDETVTYRLPISWAVSRYNRQGAMMNGKDLGVRATWRLCGRLNRENSFN